MSEFIEKLNRADALARLFHDAAITALELEEALLAEGFHSIDFQPPSAVYLNVRYPFNPTLRIEVNL